MIILVLCNIIVDGNSFSFDDVLKKDIFGPSK